MSKYTTQVRYICEHYAGLDESVGEDEALNVVTKAYPKIFDNSLVFFDEETKTRLLPKILLHYYQREIGFETVGLWKLKLNQKMREILPYYNQLYASEKLEYDPLQNVNNTHTHNGTYVDNSKTDKIHTEDFTETRNLTTVDDGSSSFDKNEDTILRHEKATTRGNDTQAHTVTAVKDQWTMFSDTPQGGIDGVSLAGGSGSAGTLADNAYLTSATHVTESPAATLDTSTFGTVTEAFNPNGDKKDHVDADGWEKTDNTNTHTGTVRNAGERIDDNKRKNDGENEYTKKEYGKIGVETYQEMQMKWRESFLNIDMQIIDELGNLFMKVW